VHRLKTWWFRRRSIIDITFRIALSGIYLRFLILEYGIDLSIKFPRFLDKVNPIRWLTHYSFRVVLSFFRHPNRCALGKYWKISKYKGLELEIAPVADMFALDYLWKIHADHWGHQAIITFVGLEFSAHYRDNRHWTGTTCPNI